MKIINKILFILVIGLLFIPRVFASNRNIVNIHIFYSESCYHCFLENKLLSELENKYDNIRVYKYEIDTDNNKELLMNVANEYSIDVKGVPCTFIGEKVSKGFDKNNSKKYIEALIEYYSRYGYRDIAGEYIGGIELPSYEINDTNEDIDKFIDNYGNFKLSFLGIKFETKNLSIPILSIIMGLIDGISICSILVLLILINILVKMDNEKRMLILGILFLILSVCLCLLSMILGSKIFISIKWIRLLIGTGFLIGSIFNIYRYLKKKDMVDNKNNVLLHKIFNKYSFVMYILLVIFLVFFANRFDGLSIMFIDILSINNMNILEKVLYIILYMLFYIIDDVIIFLIIICNKKIVSFFKKYNNLINGLLLLLMGLFLIFIPSILK